MTEIELHEEGLKVGNNVGDENVERDGEIVGVEDVDSVGVWEKHFVYKADGERELRGDALGDAVVHMVGVNVGVWEEVVVVEKKEDTDGVEVIDSMGVREGHPEGGDEGEWVLSCETLVDALLHTEADLEGLPDELVEGE